MKKLLLLAFAALCSHLLYAQTEIVIDNGTSCDVYLTLTVSVASTTPNCTSATISNIIAVGPGVHSFSTDGINYPLAPGITVPSSGNHYILSANIFHGPPSCMSGYEKVGQPCTGYSTMATFKNLKSDCSGCEDVNVKWVDYPQAVKLLLYL